MSTLRWGIIGTGWVSETFSTELIKFAPFNTTEVTHVVTAVGSSSVEKADKFVAQTLEPLISSVGIDHPSISASLYEDIYTNPDVDIVYVGSPHVHHMENVLASINAGKHVLCEKPVTVTAKQLNTILDAAKSKGVFFMEALWVRFFPANRTLTDLIYGPQKILGEVKKVSAKYTFLLLLKGNVGPEHRLVNKKLGGGAALDIGVYPLTYLRMYLDPRLDPLSDWKLTNSAIKLDGVTDRDEEKVDYSVFGAFELPDYSQSGEFYASFYGDADEYELCVIEGDKGTARIRNAGYPGTWEYTIEKDGEKNVYTFENKVPNTIGFYFQAAAVGVAIKNGQTESDIVPYSDSVAEMTILDKIRHEHKFFYDEDFQ